MTSKPLAFAALACLAVGILWSLQAATTVQTVEEVRTSDAWGERAAFEPAPLAADGAAFAYGEPGYFTNDAPRLRVGFTWRLDDATAERVTALGSLKLVVAADTRPAWTHEETLDDATLAGGAADALQLEGVIDFAAVEERVAQTPGRDAREASWRVVADVRFTSAPNAQRAADASAFELPLTYAPPLYVLPGAESLDVSKDHTIREVVTHSAPGGLGALAARPAGPLLVLGALLVLARTLPALTRDEEASA